MLNKTKIMEMENSKRNSKNNFKKLLSILSKRCRPMSRYVVKQSN